MTNSDDPSPIATRTAAMALLASSVGDPAGTRTIMSIVLLLAVLGIALLMLAMWLFRVTRPDKDLLAPLEVMGERKWRRADPVWQRRRLDEVRPGDAQPLQPSAAPPDFDEAFFDNAPAAAGGFDDLHDDAHASGDSPPAVDEPAGGPAPVDGAVDVAVEDGADEDGAGDGEAVEEATADTNGAQTAARQVSPAPSLKQVSPTPIGIERPMDLPDHEIDPELMAAALAELDAELQLGRDGKPETSDSPVD